MDDVAQKQNQDQNQQNVPAGDDTFGQAQDQTTQAQSTGLGITKEREVGKVSEFLTPSEQEPNLHPEVEEAGVETVSAPKVPSGPQINPSAESTLVQTEPAGLVQIPITKEEAIKLGKGNKTDSNTWRAVLSMKFYKVIELLLKKK